MNTKINARIEALRTYMAAHKIDFYIIPTSDYHNSEYVSEFFKVREFFSGFNGSNGSLVVSKNDAGLWTDGRYFLQADQQLEGTGIRLFRMGEKDVLTITSYIEKNIKENDRLAFNGMTMEASFGEKLDQIVEDHKASLVYEFAPEEVLWKERPSLPATKAWILDIKYAGKSFSEKIKKVRFEMEVEKASYFALSKLDDIMWLFNLRGRDISCNPVLISYTFITKDEVYLFMQKESVTEEVKKYLEINRVTLLDYGEVFTFLRAYAYSGDVWIDMSNVNYSLYKTIAENTSYIDLENPTNLMKAVKNEVEQRCLREAYIKDSVVVTKFIYQLTKTIGNTEYTEVSAAKLIDDMRKKVDGFLDLSFPTISAYGENGAIIHYEPGEKEIKLQGKGMLMVDSGGQYLNGTTDVTRTISLGQPTELEKEHYAYVCAGMLKLQNAIFMEGVTGRNLDILARQALWEKGLDYKHGTGHGVGHVLNVHEGPQNIRWNYVPGKKETAFKDGMLVSDEPGIYVAGSHGIRIENILLCKMHKESAHGSFLRFDPLTYVPLDKNLLDKKYVTEETIKQIDAYHKMVFMKISPYLTEEETDWLRDYTREI